MEQDKIKYTFSGHESFQCKSLWLKKGYDFMCQNKDFNASDAVVDLGVGKNMVSSIRFWMKAFGLREENTITQIANYIFDSETGKDPFAEDIATLWLLHYLLVSTNTASLYKLFFVDFHSEKNEFSKEQVQNFVKRKCAETANPNMYNENTINKDIDVLFKNYLAPIANKPNEDLLSLMTVLNLIRQTDRHEDNQGRKITYYNFNTIGKQKIIPEVFLYAIIDVKGSDKAVSYDVLYSLSLLFCLSSSELIDTISYIEKEYSDTLKFTDDGGIKQLLFIKELDKQKVLDNYYKN
ncbi:MAG: DUF4007 family protein [Prevotellaceae bacterium]|nr:DUF4007 family protein [Prevotellaceae bacterium]